jgi:hypothetical protein
MEKTYNGWTNYQIRIREEHHSLTGGWPKASIPERIIDAGQDHAMALALYHSTRAKTFRQQVTLYGPSGKKIKEALGTASEQAA